MQQLQKIFNFYIFSNIHVAVGAYCFTAITLKDFGFEDNKAAIVVFFATILSYNFIRLLLVPEEKNWVATWFVKHKKSVSILSLTCAIVCMVFSFNLRFEAILVLMPFAIITFFYGMTLPVKTVSLRKIPGVKIFLIALCFAGITVLFPLTENYTVYTNEVWWYFIQRLIFVILITLPFDIRDVYFDNEQLKTIPQQFGVLTAKILGLVLVIAVLSIEFLIFKNSFSFENITLIICVLSLVMLLFSKKSQSRYYSAFWVESIPIVWYVILLIINQ